MQRRHQQILERLESKGKVSVAELAQWLGVSGVTIRKDLVALEQLNRLRRAHGFALALNDLNQRIGNNVSVKEAMARSALSLLTAGDTLFIEAGSSNAHLAREIGRSGLDVTVVTPCLYVASELKNGPQEVVVLGGVLQKRSECLVGPLTRLGISSINVNKVFIGIDGYTPQQGFTGRDVMRAENIRLAIEKRVENFVIAESDKFGKLFPFNVARHADIGTVISDRLLTDEYEAVLRQHNIRLLKA